MPAVKIVAKDGVVESKDDKKTLIDTSENATRATCTTPNLKLVNQDLLEPFALDVEF